MIRLMRYCTWVLGIVLMGATTCLNAFPLPQNLKVGQQWTYLDVYKQLDSGAILDSGTETWTISIVSRHTINNKTYFMVRYGGRGDGLHRVDGLKRTWKYDAEKGTERLCWDIWREPPSLYSDGGDIWWPVYDPDDVVVVWEDRLSRSDIMGPIPYELHDFVDTHPFFWSRSYPDSKYGVPEPKTWIEALASWGASPLYEFFLEVPESPAYTLIAPNVGVLYYSWGSWGSSSKSILLSYEPEGSIPLDTIIEGVSFGEIKEQIR